MRVEYVLHVYSRLNAPSRRYNRCDGGTYVFYKSYVLISANLEHLPEVGGYSS